MKLTHHQRLLIRRRTRVKHPDPSQLAAELNIIPFLDVVVNLIMFMLVTTASVITINQVEAQLPIQGPICRGPACSQALDLSVTLTHRGMVVAGTGGMMGPGCEEVSAGEVTIPLRDGAQDFEALNQCMVRIKGLHPNERSVILSADPLVPYEDLVMAMDASRNDRERDLFPEVRISAGVR